TEGGAGTPPGFIMDPRASLMPHLNPGVTQSQSQSTVKGDTSGQVGIDDEEDQDSDREERFAFPTPRGQGDMKKPKPPPRFDEAGDDGLAEASTRRQEKGKHPVHIARRFTIEPGDQEDEVLLTDTTEDEANSIQAIVTSVDDFVQSANQSPEK
ncbi:hypothetical protein IMSHALPRED_005270, partial [Imshaugia aleurites]